MLYSTVVTTDEELLQIHLLNIANHRPLITAEQRDTEGFVSWAYPMELLRQTQALAPHVIVKDDDKVVAYAITLMPEAAGFHTDMETMFNYLGAVEYNGRPLSTYATYCMGQICIDKPWRGKGVFSMLYQQHKALFSAAFDMVITEISVSNPRSQKAHEKVGFKTIYTYVDANDTWNVVAWDWK